MTTELLLKGLIAVIISGVLAWCVFSQDHTFFSDIDNRQRYLPLVSGALLPTVLLTVLILSLVQYGVQGAAEGMLSLCFGIFLHIILYYLVLLAILPLLRDHFNARACALLWLIPNFLYVTDFQHASASMPWVVIRASGSLVWCLLSLWAVGFVGVLGWKLLSHLAFRRHILRGAVPVTDPAILEVWEEEICQANFKKPKFKLVSSPQTATPLSIGLIARRVRVVLSQREYSREELSLILRHELVHIGREDCWAKFFLVFCTAVCWFNPLMWVAMGKSADDLELSCDETVLFGCDAATRYQYANLLLKTAGDQRGFTTCLSATASALRYRLKNVVNPPKKHSGALLVGLAFFGLSMTCGYVSLAYGNVSGAQAIYQNQDCSEFYLRSISQADDPYNTTLLCPDQGAFQQYMASLELAQLTGSYTFDQPEREFTFLFDGPKGEYTLGVILQDQALKVVPLGKNTPSAQWYYLPNGTDWDQLDHLLFACPALNLDFRNPDSGESDLLGATLYQLTKTNGDTTTSIVTPEVPLDTDANGVFGQGLPATEVGLDFSYPLAEEFMVVVESWDKATRYTISQSQLEDPTVVPLANFSARYTLYATFQGDGGTTYQAVFRFDYGEPDHGSSQ
ncbi:MAG: M56 family metallopeptidase [Acutalibacter sp.]|jgi:beta-lactamase regulating signal transducer with metallopeptidase domain